MPAWPGVFESVEVTISGNRFSTKRRLLWMAFSLALAKLPDRTLGSSVVPGSINITYESRSKQITLRMSTKYAGVFDSKALSAGTATGLIAMVGGPNEVVVGTNWTAILGAGGFLGVGGGFPAGFGIPPRLPDFGRRLLDFGPFDPNAPTYFRDGSPVLNPSGDPLINPAPYPTGSPLDNPAPPIDSLALGSYAQTLVVNALKGSICEPVPTPDVAKGKAQLNYTITQLRGG